MAPARPAEGPFVVGIDLGTSNCSLAYADLRDDEPRVRVFDVPQLVAPRDVQPRPVLPSALYEAAPMELEPRDVALPWSTADERSDRSVVGEAARRLGGATPGRLIRSAKSWLCHGGVNRTSKILPWHGPDDVPKRSPVEASTAYLAHLRDAWNHAQRGEVLQLERQSVILTVPASFDEAARQLTLKAATDAGLRHVTLLEEPLAAFYAFVAKTGGTAATTGLRPGQRVLVADVGGGTTDFTLIEVGEPDDDEGPLRFERTAVGDHLLLGGDNMDLALAHALEPQLGKLDAQRWAQFGLECRLAKETLFNHPDRPDIPVVLAGRGSKLIGGTKRAVLDRETLASVVLEGYFPPLQPGEAGLPRARSAAGFREFGLPYARDPAITRHAAAFLWRQRDGDAPLPVDAVLFNGGALEPPALRERFCAVIGEWLRASSNASAANRADPRPLVYAETDPLQLAVARGAAFYGLVKQGRGLRVGGGSPRTYFLGLSEPGAEPLRVVCIAPRGLADGQLVEVPDREFQLVTNRPVAFPLYATAHPHPEPVGAVLEVEPGELDALPPLQTVVRFGKQKAGTTVPVRLQARHTEVGTLEVFCYSRMSGARFQLEFDLRGTEAPVPSAPAPTAGVAAPVEAMDVDPARIEAAKARLTHLFTEAGAGEVDRAMKGLEADLDLQRQAFPINVLRELGEHLLELVDQRGRTPAHEARWLNLVGFCLRPGFGAPVDEWRVRQLWKIHGPGPVHPGHAPVQLGWWILWRRVAGGLGRGHQEELASRLFPSLVPALHKRAKRKPPKPRSEEAAEMWRAAASLERVSAKARAQLGDALLELLTTKKAPKGALWCMSRIGARNLLYGPKEATVKPGRAVQWANALLEANLRGDERAEDCVLDLVAFTGDRQLDVEEEVRRRLDAALAERGVAPEQRRRLFEVVERDRDSRGVAYGDSLPVGITL
jgi:hypothetical protein